MKSKKLKLDDSIFDDETIELERPKPQNSRVKDPTAKSKLKTLDAKIEDLESFSTPITNKNIPSENMNIISNQLELKSDNSDSVQSEYNFSYNPKAYIQNSTNLKTVIEYLNFDTDSHLTIKTRKSSKISQPQFNASSKIDNSDSKNLSSRNDMPIKKTQFAAERYQTGGNNTIKKLTTPPANSNPMKKNFKFDLALLNKNDNKKGRVVYPHSCKNVNMAAILELQEINRNSSMNILDMNIDGSIEFNNIKNSGYKISSRINSNAKISEKSDLKSPNNAVWSKKVQNYELKIERLLLDQKFKIQNYKRMLDEKNSIITELKTELDKYRAKYAELEKNVNITKLIGHQSKNIMPNIASDDTTIYDDYNIATKKESADFHSPSTIVQSKSPLITLKKLRTSIDEVKDRTSIKISQFNTAKNIKYQTPNLHKDEESLKLYGHVSSDVKNDLNRIKNTIISFNPEKLASNNNNRAYNYITYKLVKNNSNQASPIKLGIQPTSSFQLASKNLIQKLSSNDNYTNDSAKLKSKKIKISETPKAGPSNPKSFFNPSKDFFVHYKKDNSSRYMTSTRELKQLSSSIRSKETTTKRQDKVLELSLEVKDTSKRLDAKQTTHINGNLNSISGRRSLFGFSKENY